MKPYELVLVVKASLTADEKKELLHSVEEIVGKDAIKQTDDVGVVKAAYLLENKKENTHIHLVSYYLMADPLQINVYTKGFTFLKWLIRHFFYAMKPNEKFMTYAQVHKSLETLLVDDAKQSTK